MCVLFFAYDRHPEYRLILVSNRDEFYNRPTAPLAYRGPGGDLLYGEDLEGGGTWLGVSKTGRFAAITNFRGAYAAGGFSTPSRGLLASRGLSSDMPVSEYLAAVCRDAHLYNGFSLLAGDSASLYYFTNQQQEVQKLQGGVYGLSNHVVDTPWPKVVSGKKRFNEVICSGGALETEALFSLMRDTSRPPDGELPDTGVGPEWERILAPIFIESSIYGTRTTSLVLIRHSGEVRFLERTHARGSAEREETRELGFRTALP